MSGQHLDDLERSICETLIPALTNQPAPTETVRNLLALPVCLGGMGLSNPTRTCNAQREKSLAITKPLVKRIREQCGDMRQCELEQQIIKKHIRKQYREFLKDEMATVTSALPPTQSRCAVVAQEKGSSSWLSALPIEQQGFSLSKGQF